ncbi:MAG: M48 family metallopeptidase [Planctomycetes bacterium]|jgi:Zn-dependent protease with chaperone function|nr:M48 family metallopeptidase [Planctomycetota bacterium]
MSTMDFFTGQVRAKRRTGLLVVCLSLAVLMIAVLIWLIVAGIAWVDSSGPGQAPYFQWIWTRLDLLAAAFGGTLLVVGLGTGAKFLLLRGGGAAVARALGGRLVPPGSRDPKERRLLNVVEELAIASGAPVPPVYVLDREEGINAFAAGYDLSGAVIGVTKGALDRLTRDELQGVIGHEFSHILNGDMRLNIRLIGVIHGIVVLSVIGYIALRVGGEIARAGGRTRGKSAGGVVAAAAGLAVFGLCVWLLGYIGMVFGRLIKAAVSRQREYLADASSVQFTRDPYGLSGALKKIGGLTAGSRVMSPRAEEVSHMFFALGFRTAFSSLLSTHPPLLERIRRIDPLFKPEDGEAPRKGPTRPAAPAQRGRPPVVPVPLPLPGAGVPGVAAASGLSALDSAGRPAPAHVEHAREITAGLSGKLVESAREPHGASAVVYALLLNREAGARSRQVGRLEAVCEPGVFRETVTLAPLTEALNPRSRLPLLDIAISGLRGLSLGQYRQFRENVDALIAADDRVDLFEWTLRKLLLRHVEPLFVKRPKQAGSVDSLSALAAESGTLLSALAHAGSAEPEAARRAFDAGAERLPDVPLSLSGRDATGFPALDAALDALDRATPPRKKELLAAAAAVIAADREVTGAEEELFRAIADSLGCPIPPVLPGQTLAG